MVIEYYRDIGISSHSIFLVKRSKIVEKIFLELRFIYDRYSVVSSLFNIKQHDSELAIGSISKISFQLNLVGYVLDDNEVNNGELANATYAEILFTLKSKIGWLVPGFAYLSGVLLTIALTVMVFCSLPIVRRSGYFQVRARLHADGNGASDVYGALTASNGAIGQWV